MYGPCANCCVTSMRSSTNCFCFLSCDQSFEKLSEMHYLPYQVLMKWWERSWLQLYPATSVVTDFIFSHLQNLMPGSTSYCRPIKNSTGITGYPRPVTKRDRNKLYDICAVPIFTDADSKARKMAQKIQSISGASEYEENWSPIYASLPVQRITMIRDPFDFLLSKFIWHKVRFNMNCDNVENATTLDPNIEKSNWLNDFSLEYLTYLCGEDCKVRYDSAGQDKTNIIAQLEEQSKANLRHSLTVVGLLNETSLFYDMVTTRVGFIDLSLNPTVRGKSHTTSRGTPLMCKELYRNETFRMKLIEASPTLEALYRVFNVGVEVNRFQMKELSQCTVGDQLARSRIARWVEELGL